MIQPKKPKGGKRVGAGRPSGTVKGIKEYTAIRIEKKLYLKLKKLKKSQTFNQFFSDIIGDK